MKNALQKLTKKSVLCTPKILKKSREGRFIAKIDFCSSKIIKVLTSIKYVHQKI